MIPLSPQTALLLYLALFLILCFGAWLSFHRRSRKKKILPPPYELISCEYCAFDYLAPTGEPISQCPQCTAYNKPPKS